MGLARKLGRLCLAATLLLSSFLMLTDPATQDYTLTRLQASCKMLGEAGQATCGALLGRRESLVAVLGLVQACAAMGVVTKQPLLQYLMVAYVLAASLLTGNWATQRGVGL
jgi:hypothetical protein